MNQGMSKEIMESIEREFNGITGSLTGLQYGSVSVTVRVHEGRIVDVTCSTTKSTKKKAGAA